MVRQKIERNLLERANVKRVDTLFGSYLQCERKEAGWEGEEHLSVKWNHIVIWHAVFWLFFRNMPYLLNFSLPL